MSILGNNPRGSPGIREHRAVASDVSRKLLLGLALLLLACAGLLALAKPGWAQEADQADLAMQKGAYSEPAVAGEPLTYYVFVQNMGPGTATNVVVEDTLPEGVEFVGFNQGGGQCSYDGDARTVTCNFGDLPVFGGFGYAEFQVTPAAEGTLQNTATVTSDTLDPNAGNNQATATTTVVAPTADLSVEKSAPSSAFVGEPFDYRISVSNNGPTAAPNTVVEDTLPRSVSFSGFPNDDGRCSFDELAHKVSCDLGSLGSFNSDEVRIRVTPIEEGTAENTASVSSGAPDPNDSNNQDSATSSVGTAPSPPGSLVDDPGCEANTLQRNDDGSTGAVGLPFTPNFFGNSYGTAYVNNNGNLTFDGPLGTYTPFNLNTTNRAIIAPFFADVDTRAQGSDAVTYGTADFGGRDAFCVNWTGVAGGVGYFASHDDKLNSFQLLLVDRSDIGPGDFDIIMNYNKIRWETGDASGGIGGLGGDSARVGYSNGSTASFELPGSAEDGAFLDFNPQTGLINNSRDSLQLGRYVYEVRNGDAPTGGTISGSVFRNSADPGNALQGALVQVCSEIGSCNTSPTNSIGAYSASGLADGNYEVRAFPPAGSSLSPRQIGPITLSNGETLTDQNVVLTGPQPPPPDTSIDNDTPPGGIPVVIVRQPLQLRTTGCEGGTATYEVTGEYGGNANGPMTEGPPGTYTANFSLTFIGPATVAITITGCPDPNDNETTEFNIYIDPSGYVRDTNDDPIEGATVTLYRSDSSAGPFEVVEDGSEIMSPSNRTNPDTTDEEDPATAAEEGGHFGWDVIEGSYKVRAEKVGCHAPGDETQPFVETEVMEIPPPVTNLDIRLDCPEPPTAADDQTVTLDEGASANFQLDASDPDGDTLTYTEGALANGSGSLNCDDSGACTYTPTDNDFNGSDSFTYTVDDGNGGTDQGAVSITVRSVNDNPVANNDPSEDGSYEVDEDEQLTVGAANGVLGNDTDADNDPLTAVLVDPPAHAASFELNADGSFVYKPDANFHQRDSFTYRAKDANSESNVATATIDVSPVNDPPVFITRIADQSIAENTSTGNLTFSITDNEVNSADLIVVSATSNNQTLVPESGIEVGGSGSFRFVKVTPALNKSGTATITVTLTDPDEATSTDEFLLTVNPAGDETPPSITINTPEDGAEYKLGQLVAANYFCSDGGSGVSVCDGTVDSGSNIDTASVGSKTFTVDAEDVAGNTASASHDYSVLYDFGNGSDGGFLPPVDAFPTLNSMKAGTTVPVKFALGGDQGPDIFAEGYPLSRSISCSAQLRTDPIEETVSASNSGLRYDDATGHYSYNWKTQKGWSNTCRQLILKFDDGTEHPINFKFN